MRGTGFSTGARRCKWPVSGSQSAVQRPLLVSRGSKDGRFNILENLVWARLPAAPLVLSGARVSARVHTDVQSKARAIFAR